MYSASAPKNLSNGKATSLKNPRSHSASHSSSAITQEQNRPVPVYGPPLRGPPSTSISNNFDQFLPVTNNLSPPLSYAIPFNTDSSPCRSFDTIDVRSIHATPCPHP